MAVDDLLTVQQVLDYQYPQDDPPSNAKVESNIENFIQTAYEKINGYLGYDILETTYTDEVYSGNGTHYLYLNNRPITALTTVKIDDSEQTITNFDVYNERGIYYEDGYFTEGQSNWKITYTAGYDSDTMKWDIRNVALQLISLFMVQNNFVGKSSLSDGKGISESINPNSEDEILKGLYHYVRL